MIVFWSAWLAAGIALVIIFLCKVPAVFIRRIISSACGAGDYGILTANLQDGASVLSEPSDSSSRYFARYQIYRRNSNRTFFIAEWKYPVDSAEYSIFCYDRGGALADIIRVTERVGKKRYGTVCELPASTDYVVLRIKRVNGERLRSKPAGKAVYAWLALLFASCAAAVCAALCMIYSWLIHVFSQPFNFGWSDIALSSAVVFAVCAAAFACVALWIIFIGSNRREKQAEKSGPFKKSRTYNKIGYVFTAAACKIRNAWQGIKWASPLRKFTLKKYGGEANARALRRIKKDEGNR